MHERVVCTIDILGASSHGPSEYPVAYIRSASAAVRALVRWVNFYARCFQLDPSLNTHFILIPWKNNSQGKNTEPKPAVQPLVHGIEAYLVVADHPALTLDLSPVKQPAMNVVLGDLSVQRDANGEPKVRPRTDQRSISLHHCRQRRRAPVVGHAAAGVDGFDEERVGHEF